MVRITVVVLCISVLVAACFARPGHWEHGGGKQQGAEEHSSHGENGNKGYEGTHATESGASGHHDRGGHSGHYGEDGGHKSNHHADDNHYSQHHAGEAASKGSHFDEEGSFANGHSTKGGHSVHKLNEFKKRTDFYDEDHDEGYQEKHGGFKQEHGSAKGGHDAGGHYKKVYIAGDYGKGGSYEDGKYTKEEAGHNGADGRDEYYANHAESGSEGGTGDHKQWGHGHR